MLGNNNLYGKIGFVSGLLLLSILIGGCGKKAPLDPPAGEISTFPRTYPQYAIGEDGQEQIRDFEWPYIDGDDEDPVLGDIG